MSDYIIGAVLVVCVILAVRSYFGRKYSSDTCHGCSGCPRAAECAVKKETVDKKDK